MKIKNITDLIEEWAPKEYAEHFDNIGLLLGSYDKTVTNILITLDTNENIIEEAINKKCNLIITFHPILFHPLKKIIYENRIERIIYKAIKNDISIYSIHTNFDNILHSTNHKIFEILSLNNKKILIPKKKILKKLITYVPKKYSDNIRNALFKAGAGNIGNYKYCSYNYNGVGTYQGNDYANPKIGINNKLNFEEETCINVIYEAHKEYKIKKILFQTHPYEEIPYEIIKLENLNQYLGIGIIGELSQSIDEIKFFNLLKNKLSLPYIRHSKILNKKIRTIAIVTGSGSFAIPYVKKEKIDIFISSDIKYHDFFEADNKFIIIDIEHYASEKFNKNIIFSFLKKKLPNFTIIQSTINTNPVYYHL